MLASTGCSGSSLTASNAATPPVSAACAARPRSPEAAVAQARSPQRGVCGARHSEQLRHHHLEFPPSARSHRRRLAGEERDGIDDFIRAKPSEHFGKRWHLVVALRCSSDYLRRRSEFVKEQRHSPSIPVDELCYLYPRPSALPSSSPRPATVPGTGSTLGQWSIHLHSQWGHTHDGHHRSTRCGRRRSHTRPPHRKVCGRLRRRHAVDRRPLHFRQRIVWQRPVDDARLPCRDSRAGRHGQWRVGIPGQHRRPRHHHAGRRPERSCRDEPSCTEGRPAPPRNWRNGHHQRGCVRATQPHQGGLSRFHR